MADWLRPAFTRTRTPVLGAPATFESRTREPSSGNDTIHEDTDLPTPRLRPSPRVSSYIGFRPSSPVTPCATTPDNFQNARNPENLYHKPSGDQMAETLKVVMMTRYTIDPIPVEYNACILHVLEAYQELREKVDGSGVVLEGVKEEHSRDVEEFEKMSLGWETKEREYQAEIKNLEILLANTEDGMEKVVLARSNSRVHGSTRASDEIRRSFGTIKEKHERRGREHDLDRENEDRYRYQDTMHQFPPQSTNIHTPGVSRSHLQQLDRQHMEKQQQEEHRRAMLSFESSSGIDSSSESMAGSQESTMREYPIRENNVGLGLVTDEKPLPPTPDSPDKPQVRHSRIKMPEKSVLEDPHLSLDRELSFSFQKGDDASMVTGDDKTAKIKRQMLEDLVRHRKFAVSSLQVDKFDTLDVNQAIMSSTNTLGPSPNSTPLPTLTQFDSLRPDSKPRSSGNSLNLQTLDPPTRGNSRASATTATPDKPGGSNVTDSRSESHHGRPRLDRKSGGCSEAATAAARAYFASNNNRGNGGTGGSNANRRDGSSTPDDNDNGDELRMKDWKEKGTSKLNVSRNASRDQARSA